MRTHHSSQHSFCCPLLSFRCFTSKTIAISQHCFPSMTMYKPTVITTDEKDCGSFVQHELSCPRPSRHIVFSVTQSELLLPIKYDLNAVVDLQQDSSPVQLYMRSPRGEIAISIYLLILSRSISDHHLRCGVGG